MLAEFLRTGINRYICIYSSYLKSYMFFFYANAVAQFLTFIVLLLYRQVFLRLSEGLTVQSTVSVKMSI